MSETPICDFVNQYIAQNPVRFHMPGHKGKGSLGCEALDLTEIDGADSLFEASGIIAQSEKNASARLGCATFYSTEGSSLCVRAMLYLASTCGRGRTVLAARNAHKTFLYAAALLDLDVRWLQEGSNPYLSAVISPEDMAEALDGMDEKPCCVYLTAPDYLGFGCDVQKISDVCRARGVLLVVDCAHGAYLHFLTESLFPIDLGADLCCTSAHKTLPVLTGGAYLHIGNAVKEEFVPHAKEALALFASTSPSYLILQSLDAANLYLKDHKERLASFLPRVKTLKARLRERFGEESVYGIEPMKLTLAPKTYGYTGNELAAILKKENVFPEFHDPDYIVFMPAPENSAADFARLENALLTLPRRAPIEKRPPASPTPERALSIREALFSPGERLPAKQCAGRILRDPSVSCPPAVPILMCGERIDRTALDCFDYYGVKELSVVKE